MSSSWPSNEQALSLHRRLCDGEASAPSDFAVAYVDLLGAWLKNKNPHAGEDLCQDAAHRAILEFIHRPMSYNPVRGTVETYLRLSAQGDLLNLLRKESVHQRGRRTVDFVEFDRDAGKYRRAADDATAEAHEEQRRRGAALVASVRDSLPETDRRILDLMLTDERRTAAFAVLLGVSDRPAHEQERAVKRAKDRIKKRILRAGGTS